MTRYAFAVAGIIMFPSPENDFYARTCQDQGAALARQGRLAEAVQLFHQALHYWPGFPEAHYSLGLVAYEQLHCDEAVLCFREAIRFKPDYADAHYNLGHVLLQQGRLEEGWREYEWRWHRECAMQIPYRVPRWDGAPFEGKTILLHDEQGLGDTIQFLRYAPLVKQKGGIVALGCSPVLLSLASACAGIDSVIPWGATLTIDLYASVMSLPGIFQTSLHTIPAAIPYLAADSARVEYWRGTLAGEPRFKVGIVWQGSTRHTGDSARSIPLSQFAPLAEVPGVALFGLQIGPGVEQLDTAGLPVTDLGSAFDPAALADLAAVLVNLDLLISVDTAPVHLAGALGVPVWIALPRLPDWRWLLDRSDSPWYPTARLFRQAEPGNWQPVFDQMAQALKQLVHHR
jgi:hypothetical protein